MTFNEIASIAGKGGLFHILKPTRSGVIVETLDDQPKKLVIGANQRVSILKEVSIYTTGTEDSAPLEDIMRKIHAEFDGDPGVDTSDGEELKAFLKHVVPDYDTERVYVSDMKKLVNWYKILVAYAPEVLVEEEKPEVAEGEESKSDELTAQSGAEDTSEETSGEKQEVGAQEKSEEASVEKEKNTPEETKDSDTKS